jgi:hypothetical protein
MNRLFVLGLILSTAVGLAVSAASMAGIAISIVLPALWIRQRSGRWGFHCALVYYLAALRALPVVSRNFFGAGAGLLDGVVLWLAASALLALPWRFIWSEFTKPAMWRVSIGLLASIVPPLGLIGWASPTVAAGLLFPATGYAGFALTLLMPGCLAAFPRRTLACASVLALSCNAVHSRSPEPPAGWEGIDTRYGGIAHERVDSVREYRIAEDLKARALASTARVIVFPESVVPRWTAAADLFWSDTIAALRDVGKVVLIGAITRTDTAKVDFDSSIAASLAALHQSPVIGRQSQATVVLSYRNGVVVRGASTAEFTQRVPVPIGMWRPFTSTGVPLRLFSPAVIRIADQTAAVLICYEQLIPWPALTAFAERPTMVIAIANQFWVAGTAIPDIQQNTVRAWARLFHLPVLFASNT